jgi:hypothetical protein
MVFGTGALWSPTKHRDEVQDKPRDERRVGDLLARSAAAGNESWARIDTDPAPRLRTHSMRTPKRAAANRPRSSVPASG